MKLKIYLFFVIFCYSNSILGQDSFCGHWQIVPKLYNNYVSPTTGVDYWENYWYYRTGDVSKLIPDSLIIVLEMFPSMDILPKENLVDNNETKFQIKSTLVFKYGKHDRSHNVISPMISSAILLLNDTVDLKEVYLNFINSNEMGSSFPEKKIYIKEVLKNLNISIEDGPWDFEKRGKPFALNQIIIYTTFTNMCGKIDCTSEFTFPINGAYNNSNDGKWQF